EAAEQQAMDERQRPALQALIPEWCAGDGWAAKCPVCKGPPLAARPADPAGRLACGACGGPFQWRPNGAGRKGEPGPALKITLASVDDQTRPVWRAYGQREMSPRQWKAVAGHEGVASTSGFCPLC